MTPRFAVPTLLLAFALPATPTLADPLICDPNAVAAGFFPGRAANGMVSFEDLWPAAGDVDFNDVVLAYNYAFRLDAQGRATGIRATFNPIAAGASISSGFGLGLPVPATSVRRVLRTIGGGPVESLGDGGQNVLGPGVGANAMFYIVDDVRTLFGNAPGFINTVPGQPLVPGQYVQLDVALDPPQAVDISMAPFDIFIFRTEDPTHEVHASRYQGSAIMNQALFNTGVDHSTPGNWFVDTNGLPYSLGFPNLVPYPAEMVPIDALYPAITTFAQSGGTASLDFYLNPEPGYSYSPLATPVLPTTEPAPLPNECPTATACVDQAGSPQCVDLCEAFHPCQNGSTCSATSTGYTCACASGFEGVNCEVPICIPPALPTSCQTDLANVGTDDFRVQFTFDTAQKGQLVALLSQRSNCTSPTGSSAHGWWEIRLLPGGQIVIETADELSNTHYTTLTSTHGGFNNGVNHVVVAQRINGLLTLIVDCSDEGNVASPARFGPLSPLTTNDVCIGSGDGTVPLQGSLTSQCFTHTCAPVPAPAHQWTFNEGTARDAITGATGQLLGGATVSNGALVLNNLATAPNQSTTGQRMEAALADTIGAKTLVSWVSLSNLTQRGGSALTLESTNGVVFDAVDYGERVPQQWMAGSDNYSRTPLNNGGALETSTAGEMIAISYDTANGITLYRNGTFYAGYTQGTLQSYAGGNAKALVGLRHSICNGNCWLSGTVDEARIYAAPLSACQVASLTPSSACTANTATDPNNCGACGVVCGTGLTCSNSACVPACSNTNTTANCGACGNACGVGQACTSGVCVDTQFTPPTCQSTNTCNACTQVAFAEDWEAGNPGNIWRSVDGGPINVGSESAPCAGHFLRETTLFSGGRVFTRAPIPVVGGQTYCVSSWIRSGVGTQPFLGINDSNASGGVGVEHWLLGNPGYPNGFGGTVGPVSPDGVWRWYSNQFTMDAVSHVLLKIEIFVAGLPGASDFDDIQLIKGPCPAPPAAICTAATCGP